MPPGSDTECATTGRFQFVESRTLLNAAMKRAAQECERCPLEATIRRVTAALIKTSRGGAEEEEGVGLGGRGGLTDLEGLHLFLRHLIRKSRQSDKRPLRERLPSRSLPSQQVGFETVLTAHWILPAEPPFADANMNLMMRHQ